MNERIGVPLIGVIFGYVLSHIGFSSWDEVHAMFTFASLRMFLAFCVAVVVLAGAWPVLSRAVTGGVVFRKRPIHNGTLVGGILFGAGWALTGACPSIAMVQIGEGQLGALWTLAGIFVGNYVYAAVHARYLRWDIGRCTDD